MAPADPVVLTRAYHEALNRFDPERVAAMFAGDAQYRSPGVGALVGREAIIAAMRRYFAEYAGQVAADDSVVAVDATRVCAHWRLEATSTVTGKPSIRRGVETITFNRDGLIALVEVEDR